jgi:hypothetical protein
MPHYVTLRKSTVSLYRLPSLNRSSEPWPTDQIPFVCSVEVSVYTLSRAPGAEWRAPEHRSRGDRLKSHLITRHYRGAANLRKHSTPQG